MRFIFMCIAAVLPLISTSVLLSVWVYRDAKSRGLNAVLWTVVVLIGQNLIGLIIYLLVGRKDTQAQKPINTKAYVTAIISLFLVSVLSFAGIFISAFSGNVPLEIAYSAKMYQKSYGDKWELSYGFSRETFEKTLKNISEIHIEGKCGEGDMAIYISGYDKIITAKNGESFNEAIKIDGDTKTKIIIINNDVKDADLKIHWEYSELT